MELRPYVKSYLRMHRATLFIYVLNSALESDAINADDMQYLIKGLERENGKGVDSVTSVYYVDGLLKILKKQGIILKRHVLDEFNLSHKSFIANARTICFLHPSKYPLLLDALDEYLNTISDDIEVISLVLINDLISSEISDGKGLNNIVNALQNYNVGIFMSSKLEKLNIGNDERYSFLKEIEDRVIEAEDVLKMAYDAQTMS